MVTVRVMEARKTNRWVREPSPNIILLVLKIESSII